MNYQPLLDQVQKHAQTYYDLHHNEKLLYHNRHHTQDVVDAAMQIANHYQLSDEDFFVVMAAAWFHDLGYLESCDAHEERSARLAEEYLPGLNIEPQVIQKVKDCILATKMPQRPEGLLQQIICDADLFHLGTNQFFDKTKVIRKEMEAMGKEVSKHDWRLKTIKLLEQHQYHTDYCRLLLSDTQTQNLKELIKKEDVWQAKNEQTVTDSGPQAQVQVAATEAVKASTEVTKSKKKERPDKGIETMFRVSSGNHQRLSDMADNKAHIMITVNSIILSAILSLLLRRLEDHPYLVIPTFIILVISLLAMVFSILSTRPSIPDGLFTTKDVDEKKVNLLFFGNFYRMSLDDYAAGMNKVMNDREFLYGSLIKDVYAQGVVLGKKYRLLRVAYNIFMFGLIASVIAFIIATVFAGKH
jgi:predicted metal-dependent HD superfamily phosphohydrolase